MEIPEGVKPDGPGQVCELLRSLYYRKQSAHLWEQKVKKFVTSKGFRQSTADPECSLTTEESLSPFT
jgi:hypothetical protein